MASKLSFCEGCNQHYHNVETEFHCHHQQKFKSFLFYSETTKIFVSFFLSRDDPKNCFCHSSACTTTRWECHEVNKLVKLFGLFKNQTKPNHKNSLRMSRGDKLANLSSVSVSWQIKKLGGLNVRIERQQYRRWGANN